MNSVAESPPANSPRGNKVPTQPPTSVEQLLARCERLAGRRLSELAQRNAIEVPDDLRRNKGFVGQLLETLLGATGGSRAEPDFPDLGVEMKTVPVDRKGEPLETTYVCTAPVGGAIEADWGSSWVRHKLSCVLWVPILSTPGLAVGERMVGNALLWNPSAQETAQLRADWEELTELIRRGELSQLHPRMGQALHIRPKAASGSSRTWMVDEEANWVRVNPRGFYLRRGFTAAILARNFVT